MSRPILNRRRESFASGTPSRIQSRVLLAASAIAIAFTASFLLSHYTHRPAQETFYGYAFAPAKDAYDFHLIDQNGNPFRLSQLHGKVVLLYFGYTHCPDVCPTTLTDFTNIYRTLPEKDRSRVQILFISVDPQRDHSETLKEYLSYFDRSFVGLTGNADQIKEAATSYEAAYTTIHPPGAGPDVYFINHSPFAYLVSPSGKLQLRYLFDQLRNTEKVAADIEKLLAGA
jgi:protein SCO1